jgi:4-hydroxybenzoate polyprenyltransferase
MIALVYTYVHMHSTTTRALLASLSLYTLFFVYYTLPSSLHIGTSFQFLATIKNSLFAHASSHLEGVQAYFDIAISHAFYLSILVLGAIYAYILHRNAFFALCKNSRIERVGHYFVMILLGITLSFWVGEPASHFKSWLDVTTCIILFFSFYATWMFAVLTNDITDVVSDAISNKNRPLVTGALKKHEAKNYATIFLLLALVGGYIAGGHTLYLIMVFVALSYIYSMPPFHLKRFPIINPFIIGLASLSAMLAGFYTINEDTSIGAIPISLSLLVVVTITLIANVKDIKDIEGDRSVGVYTVPVIFGLDRGKKVVALLAITALACVPLITGLTALWYLFPPFAYATYHLIAIRPFTEKYLFGLYFVYLAMCLGMYTLL